MNRNSVLDIIKRHICIEIILLAAENHIGSVIS
jgi:hypothetical protein